MIYVMNANPMHPTCVQRYFLRMLEMFNKNISAAIRPWARNVMIEYARINHN